MAKRNTPAGMVTLGFQKIALANSTALGLNTTCIQGKFFHLSVETNSVRFRSDGTAPITPTSRKMVSSRFRTDRRGTRGTARRSPSGK